mgnify:CR=1 FL=1
MEKVLRINVGAENGPVATIEELGAYAGLGGRAMTTTVVCNEVPPNCHPLGPENKLVFSPGLMAGSAAASSGRISVGCKSPLTGTIKESNSGGPGTSAYGLTVANSIGSTQLVDRVKILSPANEADTYGDYSVSFDYSKATEEQLRGWVARKGESRT